MISYYELLTMIKEGKEPKKIKLYMPSKTFNISHDGIYVAEYDINEKFSYYAIENEDEEDDIFKYYLGECFLESDMFDKNIEILDKKEIEKINIGQMLNKKKWKRDKKTWEKINEIIDIVKGLREGK